MHLSTDGAFGTTIFLEKAGTGVVVIVLALWLQCGGIALLVHWARHAMRGTVHNFGAYRSALLIVRFTAGVIILNGLQVLLWASWYRAICLPSWDTAIYFSASSYSTVGYGDVILPPAWRMLGPLEGIIGVVMTGISVGFLFAIISRLINRWEGAPPN
jgi:voltage-gated potassium channel